MRRVSETSRPASTAPLGQMVHDALSRFADRHDPHSAPPDALKRDVYWLDLPRE